jgi:hypothetical protein
MQGPNSLRLASLTEPHLLFTEAQWVDLISLEWETPENIESCGG